MRKITALAVDAFENGKRFHQGNMMVRGDEMYLFRNRIAWRNERGVLSVSLCGWDTVTTRERLNGLQGVAVYKRKGITHLNGIPWDGSEIAIR